ncbi:sodium-dependent bicarbonate transport family permease [Paenisporosarcina sp. TG20]|uniref:sodium-dependent bicarbonate transport family permease n=1 Tax=Paenisporosarcina sp. TG20 TaxID=1211706 RepID=UPI0002F70E93|nr:sodium-dependent bicarbonate transport family permease [Paenisporosarcina sp. TG20]
MDLVIDNLLTPVVLFFLLGILAALVKSDLAFPKGLSEGLSIYLLIAIGIKGGIELSHYSFDAVVVPLIASLILGVLIPVIVLFLTKAMKLDINNSIGLAATYGSVSIVTYGAATSFLTISNISYEGFMSALVVVMESPAILVSIVILKIIEKRKEGTSAIFSERLGVVSPPNFSFLDKEIFKESLFSKSIILLLGSLFIGFVLGERALPAVKPLFLDLYSSVLILFLLNMGIIARQRLPEVKKHGVKIIIFGLMAPVLFGSIGVVVGSVTGLSLTQLSAEGQKNPVAKGFDCLIWSLQMN